MKKTGWIAALSAHTTADNREISEAMVDELAATYDPKFYTARINLGHVKWYNRFGDVLQVKAEFEDGIKKLFVKLQANDLLEEINDKDQAVFLSVEIVRNFAATGKAYLTGIALTDEPASVGVGRIALSVENSKQDVEIIDDGMKLSFNNEVELEVEAKGGLISTLIQKLNNKTNDEDTEMDKQLLLAIQDENAKQATALTEAMSVIQKNKDELQTLKGENDAILKASKSQATTIEKLTQDVASFKTELATLADAKEQIETLKKDLGETLENFNRPLATGDGDAAAAEFDNII